MCDLDGAKTSLESLLDEVRALKTERDWHKQAYNRVVKQDNMLKEAVEKFMESYDALTGKKGG